MADPDELVGTSKGRVRDSINKILGIGGWAVRPKPERRARGVMREPAAPAEVQPAAASYQRAKDNWALMSDYDKKRYHNDFNEFWKLQSAFDRLNTGQ